VSGGDVALSLRTYADAMAIRRTLTTGAHVVIVGGGLIGLELAASAVRLDCSVTVIELAPTLMSRAVSKDIASIVASRHIDAGVRIVPGVGVRHIERRGRLFGIVLSNGEILRADAVIAAVGASPNTALAHAAGIAIDNGIRVDAYLRTSEPDIFAAGDCCSIPHPLFDGRRIRSEAWRSAIDQGAHAARNMLGADQVYDAVPWFWSDQYDLGIQVAGLADAASSVVVREAPNGGQIHYGLDGAGRLVSASGFGRGNAAAKDVRLGELLIRQRATPALTELSDPTFNLKRLLAAKVQEFA
jgi:3-phenylpropionate/trans-cinnamate dioxygenase ferredoxin reductase subunit